MSRFQTCFVFVDRMGGGGRGNVWCAQNRDICLLALSQSFYGIQVRVWRVCVWCRVGGIDGGTTREGRREGEKGARITFAVAYAIKKLLKLAIVVEVVFRGEVEGI